MNWRNISSSSLVLVFQSCQPITLGRTWKIWYFGPPAISSSKDLPEVVHATLPLDMLSRARALPFSEVRTCREIDIQRKPKHFSSSSIFFLARRNHQYIKQYLDTRPRRMEVPSIIGLTSKCSSSFSSIHTNSHSWQRCDTKDQVEFLLIIKRDVNDFAYANLSN